MQKIESNAKYLGKAVANRPQVVIKNNHGVVTGNDASFNDINFNTMGNQTGLIPNENHYLIKGVMLCIILYVIAMLGNTLSAEHFELGACMMVLSILLYVPAYDYLSKAKLAKKEQDKLNAQ